MQLTSSASCVEVLAVEAWTLGTTSLLSKGTICINIIFYQILKAKNYLLCLAEV